MKQGKLECKAITGYQVTREKKLMEEIKKREEEWGIDLKEIAA